MRRLILTCAAILLAIPAAHARSTQATMNVSVAVEVGADGKVAALRIDDPRAPESVRAPLMDAVRGWEFEPAKVEGRPAASRTHVHLTLSAEPVEGRRDALALRIVSASAGPGMDEAPPPRYPRRAISVGAMAEVVVEADITAEGVVTDVREHAVETNRGHERHAAMFVRASLGAVRKWRFVPEQVEGHGVATTVLVPITFCIATRPCVRMDRSQAQPALIAEHPATKLKTEVVGRIL